MSDVTTHSDAKRELEVALRKYIDSQKPGAYLDAWALVVHVMSTDDTAQNRTVIGLVAPDDQMYPTTRGLIEVASDQQRMAAQRGMA
jgi:hypothetical protein